jgi:cell division protein FtsZ
MLFKTGLINLDFAALRQVFQQRGGKTLFGLGEGAGENAVAEAVESLKLCPLLHTPEFSRKADRLLVNIIGGTDLTMAKVNELMNAITDQFGRDSNIIMGAVIDEERQNRVEVCVIGATDIGGRGVLPRRGVAARAKTPVRAEDAGRPAGEAGSLAHARGHEEPAALTLEKAAAVAAEKIAQDEFGFGEIESRGHFEKTDRNLFDGQDLDVPTYLRKGVKISI